MNKLLIICVVLSVCVAVCLAGPVKTQVRDEGDSSASAESGELKISENDSSSSEEDREQQITVKDNSSESSEEMREKNEIVQDDANENTSKEDQELTDDYVISRAKRAVMSATHANNQLFFKDEKYVKQKNLRFPLKNNFQDMRYRNKRSADTSEEKSSEEDKTEKTKVNEVDIAKKPEALQLVTKPGTDAAQDADQIGDIRRKRDSPDSDSSEENSSEEAKQKTAAKGVVISKTAESETLQSDAKTDAAPAESDHKPEVLRRRRSVEDSSEDDQARQTQDENEVFILSLEKQTGNEDNTNEDFENIEADVLSNNDFDPSAENKNSEEDYAQGCGGNRSDNSNESSNENNETL